MEAERDNSDELIEKNEGESIGASELKRKNDLLELRALKMLRNGKGLKVFSGIAGLLSVITFLGAVLRERCSANLVSSSSNFEVSRFCLIGCILSFLFGLAYCRAAKRMLEEVAKERRLEAMRENQLKIAKQSKQDVEEREKKREEQFQQMQAQIAALTAALRETKQKSAE